MRTRDPNALHAPTHAYARGLPARRHILILEFAPGDWSNTWAVLNGVYLFFWSPLLVLLVVAKLYGFALLMAVPAIPPVLNVFVLQGPPKRAWLYAVAITANLAWLGYVACFYNLFMELPGLLILLAAPQASALWVEVLAMRSRRGLRMV